MIGLEASGVALHIDKHTDVYTKTWVEINPIVNTIYMHKSTKRAHIESHRHIHIYRNRHDHRQAMTSPISDMSNAIGTDIHTDTDKDTGHRHRHRQTRTDPISSGYYLSLSLTLSFSLHLSPDSISWRCTGRGPRIAGGNSSPWLCIWMRGVDGENKQKSH